MRHCILLAALLAVTGCGDKDCDPDAAEVCNNLDDNCDGQVDEGLETQTYYADGDGDGYGTAFSAVYACALPDGYAFTDADCNDTDATINPAADELCDDIDNDCDELLDSDDGSLVDGVIGYLDEDGDGFGGAPGYSFCSLPSGFTDVGGDCDDFDATITTDAPTWYPDADGDQYGDNSAGVESCEPPSGYTDVGGDCDDTDSDISPAEEEVCDDGVDNNCDDTSGDCAPISGDISTDDADVILSGDTSQFGRWISSVDVDSDGVRNLIIANPTGLSSQGGLYVFGTLSEGQSLDGDDAAGALYGSTNVNGGYSAIGTADLTGDGMPDFASVMTDGSVVVFAGLLDGERSLYNGEAFLDGLTSSSGTDAGLLAATDLTGDAVAELIVGDPYYTGTSSYEGRVFVVEGPISGSLELEDEGSTIYGEGTTAYLGFQVERAGDSDGDGEKEILITARESSFNKNDKNDKNDKSNTDGGAAYLISGSDATSSRFDVADASGIMYGTVSSGDFGHDAAVDGDLNGDGYGDVVVGAYGQNPGAVYVFYGPHNSVRADTEADAVVNTSASGTYLGWRVAMAGDLDDDGTDDLAFAELLSSYAYSSGGAVGIVLGPVSGSHSLETADAVIYPTSSGYLGHDIAGVGDVSGDGIDDLAVSIYNGTSVWVFFGGSGF